MEDLKQPEIKEHIKLAPYTTIKLGGPARYFTECCSYDEIKQALLFAKERGLNTYLLGGGSNVIFPDKGVNGLVIHNKIPGITFSEEDNGAAIASSGAGENWDDFVKICIERDLSGIECLSGIPGYVGATPVQNVGAYGQEVKDTIVSVTAIEKETLEEKTFTNEECGFLYRESRFKNEDKDKFIITAVNFRLKKFGEPEIKYNELQKHIEESTNLNILSPGKQKLTAVRKAVIEIRKKKSMVITPGDGDSVSCGSFFTNPVISITRFASLQNRFHGVQIPNFSTENGVKIPAAWLIEKAGYTRGYTKHGAGISTVHTLALINKGGTAEDLLNLSSEIITAVNDKFGITLQREPVVINN